MNSKPSASRRLWLWLAGIATVGAAFTAGHSLAAGIPQAEPLVYSGTLLDAVGAPLTGAHDLEIRFWDDPAAATGQLCATPVSSVGLQVGRFSVPLPAACTDAVHANPDLWVEVVVDDASLGRAKAGAVPYAVEADHAVAADEAAHATTADEADQATLADEAFTANALGALTPGDVQLRVTGSCPVGSSISAVLSDGSVACEADDVGTPGLTGINTAAGSGLAGGCTANTCSLSVAAQGIGTTMLAASAVTAAQLAANAVATGNIADGAVSNADLAANAVDSAKIVDGSITATDLAADTLGLSVTLVQESTNFNLPANGTGAIQALCPAGSIVTGGGCTVNTDDTPVVELIWTFPTNDIDLDITGLTSNQVGTAGWGCGFRNNGTAARTGLAFALCLNTTLP